MSGLQESGCDSEHSVLRTARDLGEFQNMKGLLERTWKIKQQLRWLQLSAVAVTRKKLGTASGDLGDGQKPKGSRERSMKIED